jgi:hypothetical protein
VSTKLITVPVTRSIELVRPDRVTVDKRVQRPLDERRVNAIVDNFQPNMIGVPIVSARRDGTIVALDGQTRIAALCRKDLGEVPVSMAVFRGMSLEEEAETFKIHNDSKRLSAADLFRVALTEKDPIAVACERYLKLSGWTSEPGKVNTMAAVNTLLRCYERHPMSTRRALLLLAGTWGATKQSGSAMLLQGAADWFFRYDAFGIDVDAFARKLAKEPGGTPVALLVRARGSAATRGIKVPDAVSDILTNTYNKSKPGDRKLPDWATAR